MTGAAGGGQRGHRRDPAEVPLSAGTNAPVTIDGDGVIVGAGVAGPGQRPLIIAYELGGTGRLPDTVHS